MKPFFVILATFLLTLTTTYLLNQDLNYSLAGAVAMAIMLVFTAIGHFAFTKGMSMMLPGFIPYKKEVVWITGVIEIVAAVGILIPNYRAITGWLLIIFFLLILPANIYAAKKTVDYQKGNHQGKGIHYLWIRVPLQIFYIIWSYVFLIHLTAG